MSSDNSGIPQPLPQPIPLPVAQPLPAPGSLRVLGIIGLIVAVLNIVLDLATAGIGLARMSNIDGTGPFIIALAAMSAVALAMSVMLLVASIGMTMRRRWGRTWGLVWAWITIPCTVLLAIAVFAVEAALMQSANVSESFQIHVVFNAFSIPFAIVLLAMLMSGRIARWANPTGLTTSVLARLSLLLTFYPPPVLAQITALILGCVALRKISRSKGSLRGKAWRSVAW